MTNTILCVGNNQALSVDFSKYITDRIQKYLTAEGYDTHAVQDGAEALSFCDKVNPKIVTLGLDLRILDGFQTLRRITKNFPQITTIVVSSLENTAIMEKCFAFGAKGYLSKPFTKNEFINTLQNSSGSQEQTKMYHILQRSISRIDNAIRRLLPNSTVSLTTVKVFLKSKSENPHYEFISSSPVQNTKTRSAPKEKIGFMDLLTGSGEGTMLSFVDKNSVSYLEKHEDEIGNIDGFFDMIHSKIVSELSESLEKEIYIKRCNRFVAQDFDVPLHDMIEIQFAVTTDKEILNFDTFVWLPE